MSKQTLEPVFIARIGRLRRAAAYLREHGIGSRHSSPRRSEGILRVASTAAARARSLLEAEFAEGVVSATQAAWFSCPDCNTPLALGQTRCHDCGAFVGDPHAG
jgi:hypothetical protein